MVVYLIYGMELVYGGVDDGKFGMFFFLSVKVFYVVGLFNVGVFWFEGFVYVVYGLLEEN